MPQMNKKNKGGSGWLTYLGVAFLIGGSAFFYFRVLTGKELTPVEGAEVVPESAMMTAFISTEPKSWQKLQQFGSNEAQELIGKTIADWEQEAYADSRIDYQKDIQPWIGNAMVAFLPSESGSWDRDGENLLLVLGIKNKLKAWNFAEKLQKEEGKEITKTQYKGVTIYLETSTDSDEQGATAILDNYNKVVFSEKIETIKLAIDTYKGEKTSFVANPEAKKALSQKLGLKNPIFAFYLADYGELIGQSWASTSNEELPEETLAQLMVVESAVMGLGFEDKGLRLKYLANLNQSALKGEYKPEKGKIVSRFPESTIALTTGSKVNEGWSNLVAQSEVVPQLDQLLNTWETMFGSINLDLNEDVFGWMDGEVGLGLVTVDEGIFKDYGMGGAAIFQTSDRQTATNTLKKLEELAAGNSFITIDRRSIKGKTIVEWIADNKVLLSYGWTDDQTLTVALGTPFKELMEVKGKNSLAGSKNFKDLTGSLPEKNFGYFYLDMKKLMAVLNNLPSAPSNYSPESKAVLDSIRGIAATSTMGDRSTAELDLLLHLEPND